MAEQPFDADGTGATTDIPEKLACARGERGQGHSPDLAFAELSVMHEQFVRQPGGERDDLRVRIGYQFDGDEVERLEVVEAEAAGARRADALARAAKRFENMERGASEAARGEIMRDRGRRAGIGGQH